MQDPDDPTGFEVDRHIDDQPPRDDLIDPENIDPENVEGAQPELIPEDLEAGRFPPGEEQPESQGFDAADAPHLTEDASSRELLSDEQLEQEQ